MNRKEQRRKDRKQKEGNMERLKDEQASVTLKMHAPKADLPTNYK